MVYYGWIVMLATIPVFLVTSAISSWSEFVAALSAPEAGIVCTVTSLGFVQSVYSVGAFVSSPFTKMAAKKMNIRLTFVIGMAVVIFGLSLSTKAHDIPYLMLSRGILVGVGTNFTLLPLTFLVAQWFPWEHRYHVFATSFRMMINPLGNAVGANLVRWINDSFGWRYSFGGLALFAAVTFIVVLPFLRHPDSSDKDLGESEKSQLSWSLSSKSVICFLWVTISVCKAVGQTVYYTIAVKYGKDLGFDTLSATHPLTAEGITGSISRALTSFLGDYIKGYILHMYVICAWMLCLANFAVPFFNSLFGLIVCGAVIGMGQGPIMAAWYAACSEVLGGQSVKNLYVQQVVSWGIGQSFGSVLPGLFLDLKLSYTALFNTLAVLYGYIAIGFIIIIHLNRRQVTLERNIMPHK